jgi:N-acetylmuramoyl-L-alanine amidase
VEDFQLNTGLPVDGICGPSTLQALARVSSRADGDAVVAEVRERARLRGTPRTLFGCRVAIGEPGGLSSLAESTRRMVARMGASPLTLHDPDESAQAVQANANGAEVYLGLRLDPEGEGCRTAYFLGHSGYRSEGGHRLAHLALESVCRAVDVKGLGCRGMSVPILRETRMPAVLVELAPPRVVVEEANLVALGLSRALAAWVADPCPD